MPYTDQYSAKFAGPLLPQLVAIIQRDQAAALAIVNSYRAGLGRAALMPIAEFHFGPGARTAFPWLFIGIVGGGAKHVHEGEWSPREQTVVISLDLDVGLFDQESAQVDAADYYMLLDKIISNCDLSPQNPGPGSSWETGLAIVHETVPSGTTAPNASGSVKEVFISDYLYGQVNVTGIEGPVMRMSTRVLFDMEES
ncbi:MAG TPA: hypothetical protein VGZ29_05760 [Terriglobia bacterium]|nr:hypothetical protein [Terriglobia bacterium]